jgi:hypothetical protein
MNTTLARLLLASRSGNRSLGGHRQHEKRTDGRFGAATRYRPPDRR